MDASLKNWNSEKGGTGGRAVFARCQVGPKRQYWAVWRNEKDALAATEPYAASHTDTRKNADWAARMVAGNELHCREPNRLPGNVAEAVREQHVKRVQAEEAEERSRHYDGKGVGKKTVVNSLKTQRKWVKQQLQSRATREKGFHAHNIMVGAVQSINQCGQSIQGWLSRRGQRNDRRKALRDIECRYHLPVPNKALIDLIDFAISTLEAASWVERFWVGALPIQEPRTISESHKKALLDGQVRRRERDQNERARRFGFEALINTAEAPNLPPPDVRRNPRLESTVCIGSCSTLCNPQTPEKEGVEEPKCRPLEDSVVSDRGAQRSGTR